MRTPYSPESIVFAAIGTMLGAVATPGLWAAHGTAGRAALVFVWVALPIVWFDVVRSRRARSSR